MKMFQNLKRVYTKDYLLLIGIGFLPLIWKILEIYFLVSFSNSLKILGQVALLSIIFKIFEETILNPMYKILSRWDRSDSVDSHNVSHKFLIFYSMATVIFTMLLLLLARYILIISQVPEYIFRETLVFIRIYIVACGIGVVSKYLYTCSLICKDSKKLFIYFLIKSFATTILFLIFVPKFTFGLGVNGIAIVEIVINASTILFLFNFQNDGVDISIDKKEYFRLLGLAFLETVVRNLVYYFVILVFLNMIDNQDLYFVSNEFIWSIMLVPTLAQSSLIKQVVSNDKDSSLMPYFANSIFLILFMLILIPIALIVFKYVYCLPNYMEYFMTLLKLSPCYIVFIIDSIIESYFVATGEFHHVLVQTIITNILVYMTALILYLFGVWTITIDAIILLFNLGVVVSSIYTISVYLLKYRAK